MSRQSQEKAPPPAPEEGWNGAQASDLYRVDAWGDGFFHVNERGHAAVRPLEDTSISIDIVDVVADIRARGVQPPDASWGTIIQDGQNLLYSRPMVALAPGIAIAVTVLTLNVLGDGVRDALDPRSKLRIGGD